MQIEPLRATYAIQDREPVFISPEDAAAHGIAHGDLVRVFNDRGQLIAGANVSDNFPPGVVRIQEGAWYGPTGPEIGALDTYGDPNTLTLDIGTSSLAQATSANTCLVEHREVHRRRAGGDVLRRADRSRPAGPGGQAGVSDAKAAAVGEAGLEPAEWRLVGRQRALVYGWLSTIYAAEIPPRTLAAYLGGEAAPLLGGLAALGLEPEVGRVQAAWRCSPPRPTPRSNSRPTSPSSSCSTRGPARRRMPRPTRATVPTACCPAPPPRGCAPSSPNSALAVHDRFREPTDHLAIQLALMARLVEQHAEADAERLAAAARDETAFLRDTLLGWLPRFADRSQRAGLASTSTRRWLRFCWPTCAPTLCSSTTPRRATDFPASIRRHTRRGRLSIG